MQLVSHTQLNRGYHLPLRCCERSQHHNLQRDTQNRRTDIKVLVPEVIIQHIWTNRLTLGNMIYLLLRYSPIVNYTSLIAGTFELVFPTPHASPTKTHGKSGHRENAWTAVQPGGV